MRYTPLDKYYASEQVVEALEKVLGDICDINKDFCGDPVMRKLFNDLQDLAYMYSKHHEDLRNEACFYEDEEAM